MGLLSGAINTYYTFKFLRLLTQKWENTDAFKLGIVDEKGNPLKRVSELKTPDEKSAYSIFNRLVFNVKRIMNKVPFGRSALGSYAAALFLLKEHEVDLDNTEIREALDIDLTRLNEAPEWFVLSEGVLMPGVYELKRDIASPITGLVTGRVGHKVVVENNCLPVDKVFSNNIYKINHKMSGQDLYILSDDLKRC
jgi:hypothetical protein